MYIYFRQQLYTNSQKYFLVICRERPVPSNMHAWYDDPKVDGGYEIGAQVNYGCNNGYQSKGDIPFRQWCEFDS